MCAFIIDNWTVVRWLSLLERVNCLRQTFVIGLTDRMLVVSQQITSIVRIYVIYATETTCTEFIERSANRKQQSISFHSVLIKFVLLLNTYMFCQFVCILLSDLADSAHIYHINIQLCLASAVWSLLMIIQWCLWLCIMHMLFSKRSNLSSCSI